MLSRQVEVLSAMLAEVENNFPERLNAVLKRRQTFPSLQHIKTVEVHHGRTMSYNEPVSKNKSAWLG